ncbi:MAG: HAMP domain-containing sensor histidine kinase [Chloroherpetonaceae bacterium]|nr:HAMP domain-containing sensor histidine kinase [Chloroherpetonaceae bacterium]
MSHTIPEIIEEPHHFPSNLLDQLKKLLEIALGMKDKEMANALFYANRAITAAEKLLYQSAENEEEVFLYQTYLADALALAGRLGWLIDRDAKSLSRLFEAGRVYERLGETKKRVLLSLDLSTVFLSLEENEDSEKWATLSQTLVAQLPQNEELVTYLIPLSQIYARLGKREISLNLLGMAVPYCKSEQERNRICSIMFYIQALIAENQGTIEKALEHFKQSLSRFTVPSPLSCEVKFALGRFYEHCGEIDIADRVFSDVYDELQHIAFNESPNDIKDPFNLREAIIQFMNQPLGIKSGEALHFEMRGFFFGEFKNTFQKQIFHLIGFRIKNGRSEEAISLIKESLLHTAVLFSGPIAKSKLLKYWATALRSKGDFEEANQRLEESQILFEKGLEQKFAEKEKDLKLIYEIELAQTEADIFRVKNEELARANKALQDALLTGEDLRNEYALINESLQDALKQAEDAMAEAEKQRHSAEKANHFKTELLSLAAHDLKNPLQSILGLSKLTLDALEPNSQHFSFQSRIYTSAERMITIIDDLLANASRDAIKLVMKMTNFSRLVELIVDSNQELANQNEQTLLLTIEKDLYLNTDTSKLSEILDNLLSNAMKYSDRKKRICVDVFRFSKEQEATILIPEILPLNELVQEVDPIFSDIEFESINPYTHKICAGFLPLGRYVCVAIRDEGQGLSENDLALAFKKFQRLSSKPTKGESSTGLGLSIVKQLTELLGGNLILKSAGKNRGCSFLIAFPESELQKESLQMSYYKPLE